MAMNVSAGSGTSTGILSLVDNPDLGKLLLRVNLGFLLIWHGINFSQGHTNQLDTLASIGIPGVIGFPLGILFEIICPILAVLGIFGRLAGAGMAIFMLFAIGLQHVSSGHLFMLEANRQGFFDSYFLERQFFFLFNALGLLFIGAGRYGLNIGGKWNN
jgi:putative oxidoreductase